MITLKLQNSHYIRYSLLLYFEFYGAVGIVSNYSTGDHQLSFSYAKLARRSERKAALRYLRIFSRQPSTNHRLGYSMRISTNYLAYLLLALLAFLLEKFEIPTLSCC